MIFVRGDIVRVKGRRDSVGHEQRGERLAVVVQDDHYNGLSTLVVCPTSTSAGPGAFRPEIDVHGRATRVMVEQISALDLGRVLHQVGHVSHADMTEIDEILKRFLGLR